MSIHNLVKERVIDGPSVTNPDLMSIHNTLRIAIKVSISVTNPDLMSIHNENCPPFIKIKY